MVSPAFEARAEAIADLPGAATIHVGGRITLAEAPALRRQVLAEVESTAATRLVVELSGVSEMDTSGAAVLIEAIRRAQQRGIALLLCSPSESVVQLFQLAGLEDVLDFCCANPGETRRRLESLH